MTKQQKDQHNEKCLLDYMEEKGIAVEEHDDLPFCETGVGKIKEEDVVEAIRQHQPVTGRELGKILKRPRTLSLCDILMKLEKDQVIKSNHTKWTFV